MCDLEIVILFHLQCFIVMGWYIVLFIMNALKSGCASMCMHLPLDGYIGLDLYQMQQITLVKYRL